jgi:hypothetical protein
VASSLTTTVGPVSSNKHTKSERHMLTRCPCSSQSTGTKTIDDITSPHLMRLLLLSLEMKLKHPGPRDIVLHQRDGPLQRVNEGSAMYESLQYPLFFIMVRMVTTMISPCPQQHQAAFSDRLHRIPYPTTRTRVLTAAPWWSSVPAVLG